MTLATTGTLTYRSCDEDPLSAEAIYQYRIGHTRDDWDVGVECEVRVRCDADTMWVEGEYRALENDDTLRTRPVSLRIPRRWM